MSQLRYSTSMSLDGFVAGPLSLRERRQTAATWRCLVAPARRSSIWLAA
jgi:hypothetical protein